MIESYLEGARTLASVATEAQVTVRTAQRWVERYRKDGLASLLRRERMDQGSRRVISNQMLETIEGLALERPRVPITAIYRELKEFAAQTGEQLPSYPAVYRVVRAMPVSLLTLAHQSSRVYSETFDLVHRREASVGRIHSARYRHRVLDPAQARLLSSPEQPCPRSTRDWKN